LRKYVKLLVVVDGAKYHFEKEHVQKFYEENKHRLVIVQLPSYNPTLILLNRSGIKLKNGW